MKISRNILKKSKWIHKYFGLLLILFLIWMSFSGILLNHPHWIADWSVPGWMIPDQYRIQNWNRSALISLAYAEAKPQTLYVGGKQGIWRSVDGGKNFKRFENGFERSAYYKKTKHLFLIEEPATFLLAATDGGLWINDLNGSAWRRIPLGTEHEAVRKVVRIKEDLLVFSESHVYRSPVAGYPDFDFKQMHWTRSEPGRTVTLIDLFFHLHDGRVWGLPGKLLFDFSGLVLIFLGISAFYIWYFPNKMRRYKSQNRRMDVQKMARPFRFLYKYHLKLGIWLALILLIVGGTGFFMRPPVLALIAEGSIPAAYYPGPLPKNQWHEKIHNAMHDPVTGQILISASDGVWAGPADFSAAYQRRNLNTPLFVMGATVFEPYGMAGYLIGSFNGIYHRERQTGKAFNLMQGEYALNWSDVRPSDYMVTGYFRLPNGDEFITTHEQGLIRLGVTDTQPDPPLNMPPGLRDSPEMSLWNFMFELHNGRIFKDWIGGIYILLVPLGSLLFVLITVSGIYDWIILKMLKRRKT